MRDMIKASRDPMRRLFYAEHEQCLLIFQFSVESRWHLSSFLFRYQQNCQTGPGQIFCLKTIHFPQVLHQDALHL